MIVFPAAVLDGDPPRGHRVERGKRRALANALNTPFYMRRKQIYVQKKLMS